MPRSPCTCNGMADHWIAQALWHCMTNTQSVGNYQQSHPKPTATSGGGLHEMGKGSVRAAIASEGYLSDDEFRLHDMHVHDQYL